MPTTPSIEKLVAKLKRTLTRQVQAVEETREQIADLTAATEKAKRQ